MHLHYFLEILHHTSSDIENKQTYGLVEKKRRGGEERANQLEELHSLNLRRPSLKA